MRRIWNWIVGLAERPLRGMFSEPMTADHLRRVLAKCLVGLILFAIAMIAAQFVFPSRADAIRSIVPIGIALPAAAFAYAFPVRFQFLKRCQDAKSRAFEAATEMSLLLRSNPQNSPQMALTVSRFLTTLSDLHEFLPADSPIRDAIKPVQAAVATQAPPTPGVRQDLVGAMARAVEGFVIALMSMRCP